MSLREILFRSPWIPYNDKFLQSRITLTYPENAIFTAQLLKHVMESDVYKNYPQAETMDCSEFDRIDWTDAIIVFDNELNLILAPDPVHRLVRLDRRLQYERAAEAIFGSFRVFPFLETFNYMGFGIFAILLIYVLNRLYALRYRVGFLTLSNKTLNDSRDRPNQ